MARILVIYHSIKGPVAQVADEVAAGARDVSGTDVVVKSVHVVVTVCSRERICCWRITCY